MTRSRPGPDPDSLLEGRISSVAQRHARWGNLSAADRTAGVAELREIAGDRPDLLAQAAGLAEGFAEGKGPEYEALAQAVAELCRLAGADENLIAGWVEEGRRRRANADRPPVSDPRH